MIKQILKIFILLLLCSPAYAQDYSNSQIANAIYLAEGRSRAQFAYGIRSVKYANIAEARRICLRTVRNNRKRYADYGYKQYPDFLSFLASRYCPTKGRLSQVEKRVNKHWLKNVRYFLQKGEK